MKSTRGEPSVVDYVVIADPLARAHLKRNAEMLRLPSMFAHKATRIVHKRASCVRTGVSEHGNTRILKC
jgi:hypothetical protein